MAGTVGRIQDSIAASLLRNRSAVASAANEVYFLVRLFGCLWNYSHLDDWVIVKWCRLVVAQSPTRARVTWRRVSYRGRRYCDTVQGSPFTPRQAPGNLKRSDEWITRCRMFAAINLFSRLCPTPTDDTRFSWRRVISVGAGVGSCCRPSGDLVWIRWTLKKWLSSSTYRG
jgi:hypothetical protein